MGTRNGEPVTGKQEHGTEKPGHGTEKPGHGTEKPGHGTGEQEHGTEKPGHRHRVPRTCGSHGMHIRQMKPKQESWNKDPKPGT